MKIKVLALMMLFGLAASSAPAAISINPVDANSFDGYGGVYLIDGDGFNNENYWWMCIEPNGSSAGSFIADAISFLGGWDQQNSERLSFYENDPGSNYATAVPLQVKVMEYVLDTYLPWHLAGPSNRFLEQDSNKSNYDEDMEFYNAFFTVQHFLAEAYGKGNKIDFTDMSDFLHLDPMDGGPWDGGSAAGNASALAARTAYFDLILADVENKAGIAGFFENYSVLGTYIIANTQFPELDAGNYQDALIIVAPAPEPSGALLIGCAGLLVMFRRFRRLA